MQSFDTWSWTTCNLPLRQTVQGDLANPLIWPLKPAITLLHPRRDGPNPIINLHVESEKSFQLTEGVGWNWHKSWKLPIISIKLELLDPDTKELLLCPNDIFAQIFAVRASPDEEKNICLTDVGLKGITKVPLVDGKGVFQTLKFSSTSYNNEGLKFHLVICIYLQVSEDTPPKMLKAIISSPIFVDSRKSVKDSEKIKDNKLFIYFNPFEPDNFTKRFVKRETKKRESIEEDIQNNVEGLCSYLTAPNIRNKVKHPIFLSIRFANCISFYYNPTELNTQAKPNYGELLQDLLYKDMQIPGNLREFRPEESVFLLCVDIQSLEDKARRKKITESLNPVKCKSLSVIFNKSEVPPHFVKFTDLDSMMELYSKSYSKLSKKAKSFLQDDENEEEDGPTDRLPPPDKQVINFKLHKAPKRDTWHRYFDIPSQDSIQKKIKTESNSSPPQSMVESFSAIRSISVPDFSIKNDLTSHHPAELVARKSSTPAGVINYASAAQVPHMQSQSLIGLVQNGQGYLGNIPARIIYVPTTVHIVDNFGNPATSFPSTINANVAGIPALESIGQVSSLNNLANMIKLGLNGQQNLYHENDHSSNPIYKMIQKNATSLMEQLDVKESDLKQLTGSLQGFKRVGFEKEGQIEGFQSIGSSLVSNTKRDTKPVLLQWQGNALDDSLFKKRGLEKMEVEGRLDNKVKSEEDQRDFRRKI